MVMMPGWGWRRNCMYVTIAVVTRTVVPKLAAATLQKECAGDEAEDEDNLFHKALFFKR